MQWDTAYKTRVDLLSPVTRRFIGKTSAAGLRWWLVWFYHTAFQKPVSLINISSTKTCSQDLSTIRATCQHWNRLLPFLQLNARVLGWTANPRRLRAQMKDGGAEAEDGGRTGRENVKDYTVRRWCTPLPLGSAAQINAVDLWLHWWTSRLTSFHVRTHRRTKESRDFLKVTFVPDPWMTCCSRWYETFIYSCTRSLSCM